MKKIIAFLLCAVMALSLFGCKKDTVDKDTVYYADIVIEEYGTITVKLDQSAAPVTVENFVNLAKDGFYTGLTFHRIINGFMMQGGASANPPESIVGEFSSNGHDNPLEHTRGAISMARSNMPDSASSQFFIVHQDAPHLNGQYACFGYVTEGMQIVDEICGNVVNTDGNGGVAESDQPVISSITIREE